MPTTPTQTAHADPLLAAAQTALERVADPEIPVVSIAELGILRAVRYAATEPDLIEVLITPTYSGCPAMTQIIDDVAAALRQAGIARHRITTVLAPAWTTDWITAAGRAKLAQYGIAPPAAAAAPGNVPHPVRIMRRSVDAAAPACPRCGSPNTEQLAAFGSTACKALYRCADCREPFDYLKPY